MRVSHDGAYPEHTVTEHEEMCMICMDSIDQTEENEAANHDGTQSPRTLLPLSLQSCGHEFHIFCLAGAVQAAFAVEETPTCALCRTRISQSDLDAIDDVVTNSVVCSTAPTCTPELLFQPGGRGMRAMTALPAAVEHAVPYSPSQGANNMPWQRMPSVMPVVVPLGEILGQRNPRGSIDREAVDSLEAATSSSISSSTSSATASVSSYAVSSASSSAASSVASSSSSSLRLVSASRLINSRTCMLRGLSFRKTSLLSRSTSSFS